MDILIKSLLHVNLDFALPVVSNILILGLIIFPKISYLVLTDMSCLPFLSNAGNSSSMTELFLLNLLRLLTMSLNTNSIIFTVKIKELIESLNLLIYTLLPLMSFIMDLLLLFTPLAEISNGILIFMLLSLLEVLINFFTLLIFLISMLLLSLINGNFSYLILFPMVNILMIIFV